MCGAMGMGLWALVGGRLWAWQAALRHHATLAGSLQAGNSASCLEPDILPSWLALPGYLTAGAAALQIKSAMLDSANESIAALKAEVSDLGAEGDDARRAAGVGCGIHRISCALCMGGLRGVAAAVAPFL